MENKERYIYINGEKVYVTEEIYKEYMRPIWREERNKRNRWRCRDANGVRCKKDCIECEIALLGYGATGSDLSLERMIEEEDPQLVYSPDPMKVAILKEQYQEVMQQVEKMSETRQFIIKKIIEGYSQRSCAEMLGVEEYYVSRELKRIRKVLEKI